MPVTTTAKRALRSSVKKGVINKTILTKLDIAIRLARKTRKDKDIEVATSLSDRAAKKRVIHKNKASRIKSQLSKLLSKKTPKTPKTKKK